MPYSGVRGARTPDRQWTWTARPRCFRIGTSGDQGGIEEMRARTGATLWAILVIASASATLGEPECKDCPPFPVPRAESEFRELLEVPRGFASIADEAALLP